MTRKKNSSKTEFIYGIHAVRHTLRQSPAEVLELWVMDGKRSTADLTDLIETAAAAMIGIQYVSRDALDKISGGAVHQGVGVRCRITTQASVSLETLLESFSDDTPLLLVLDGIQDPHNLGACLRTANAAGVNAIIIPKDRNVSVNPTVRKTASGAAEYTPVIYVTNLARSLEQMKQRGIWCMGLAAQAGSDIFTADLTVPLALVLGAEGSGLRPNTRNHCDKLVRIPMSGQVESLNVSVAAAISLYEALRQRQAQSNKQ